MKKMKNTIKSIAIISLAVCAISAKASYSYAVNSSPGDYVTGDIGPVDPGSTVNSATFNVVLGGANSARYTWGSAALSVYAGDISSPTGSPLTGGSSPFTALSLTGGGFTPGQIYAKGVTSPNWTVSFTLKSAGLNAGDVYTVFFTPTFSAFTGNGSSSPIDNPAQAYGNFNVEIAAVPEPSQAIAGAMLLGCGALVFTGRRWMRKNAAK